MVCTWQVKFEEYMDDMGRVVGAVIPEKSTALRLNKVYTLKLELLAS